jgi:hypothetical protein
MGKKDSDKFTLKKAAIEFLNQGGKFAKVPAALTGAFTVNVYDCNPQFLVSDDSNFIGAYLTHAAYDKFIKNHKSTLLSDTLGSYF